MRLLCDEMLTALARWLRAAGYDTATVDPSTPDAAILERLQWDGRMLLTRDRKLAEKVTAAQVYLVEENELDAQAAVIATALSIDWTFAPFSRCLVDNTLLRDASADEISTMPSSAQALGGPFRTCPDCHRIYWPGSHVRRMNEKLRQWREEASARPHGQHV